MVDGRRGPTPPDPHADHDPEIVASLLDRELTGPDRAAAARQVASCPACAALHADLRLLASATVALPTPARPRDFRLTAADAAGLREPVAVAARLTGEMSDSRNHATHDTVLVAGLADRTIAGPDRERAEALVGACGLCAGLRDDFVAIRAATRSLPTPPRPRDYQLTQNDAVRLRPHGWRRLVAAIGSSRDSFTRPLAVGLTTLGLAGLLVATVPSILTGTTGLGPSSGAATLPASGGATEQRAAAPAAASAAASTESVLVPGASGDPADVRAAAIPSTADASAPVFNVDAGAPEPTLELGAPAGSQTPLADRSGDKATVTPGVAAAAAPSPMATSSDLSAETAALEGSVPGASSGLSMLAVLSGALLLAGLGLFALRRIARRVAD